VESNEIAVTPEMSLNRVVIAGLPGMQYSERVIGKTAYDLLSARTLTGMVKLRLDALKIPRTLADHEILLAYDLTLLKGSDEVLKVGQEIAKEMGENLDYVLLTLKRGDEINRLARPEWSNRHWETWKQINRVYLGGGLVSGALGEQMVGWAQEIVSANGIKDLEITRAPFGAVLPLLGSACVLPAYTKTSLVFDFGGSRIKRGAVGLKDGEIVELQLLPFLQTPWENIRRDSNPFSKGSNIIMGMLEIIADTWNMVPKNRESMSRILPVSMAAHMQEGKLFAAQRGIYTQTLRVTHDLEKTLSRSISAILGEDTSIHLSHDGSAAANVYSGERSIAVITLGTALGIGFPRGDIDLRRISPKFTLIS
jgi:hypothetical protein